MSKFKIGNRVVCLKKNPWIPVGTIGTVDEYDDCPFVKWDNGTRYFLSEKSMELVEEKKFKVGNRYDYKTKTGFDVGDKVVFHQQSDASYAVKDGTEGVILKELKNSFVWDYIVKFEGDRGITVELNGKSYTNCQYVKIEDIKPAPVKYNIVMYRKGNTVVAQLHKGKTVVATAEAKCSPDDEFNFFVGSQIALQRLSREVAENNAVIVVPNDLKLNELYMY